MDHKILNTQNQDVLIYRAETQNEETQDFDQTVTVQAWLKDTHEEDGESVFKFEEIEFELPEQARAFIRDYSEASAEEFLARHAL
ncbi:hypothetical protein GU926_08295 [Nibribacter ruber]|uniref:Uncharacterized protein n=1 Tax=Nibribacter ruber TaxID=2698458 RepID=A0A6P1NU90_9BACT|nr:hypothetical protein [Nibribacter ruber]QHL87436.1 hypothetical protein GU926_08295 [Nibribacter ruber]